MGQESGEKWAVAVGLQPAIPKSDRLLGGRLPEARVVSSAINEIMSRMEQGWAYMKM